MISYLQAIILGLVQGITELFPISSLGHSIILPALLRWNLNQSAESFLIFLTATHLATALVLFFFYLKDWKRIIIGFFKSLKKREISNNPDAKLAWLLIAGTIPAGLVGLIFEKKLSQFFSMPLYVSVFLILNGLMLFCAELLIKKAKKLENVQDSDKRIAGELSFWQSIKIGFMQVLALIPGFSRTGSAITGGLLVGLSREDAVRFSFLLATPIIGAAAVLELPKLLKSGNIQSIDVAVVGAIAAAIAAYFSVKFLTKYFKTNKLNPFAIYCVIVGILSLIILIR
jgi:undecaprenyl-diphosphatase